MVVSIKRTDGKYRRSHWRHGPKRLRVPLKILPRVLLDLFVSVQSFLGPGREKIELVDQSYDGTVAGVMQLTHSTGTLGSIKARFCILKKRSLNKLPSGCNQIRPLKD